MSSEILLSLREASLTYKISSQLFSKKHAHVQALRGISFEVRRGDRLGVIGRNGSGKSTLMKVLSGIFEPDSGELYKHPKARVQLLSLGVGLEGSLSGRENAILNGMLLGRTRRHMLERIERIKDFSELGEFFEYPVNTYSSGMVTRLGFSVALEVDPDVLLIDEVLGVGDASFYQKSHAALKARFTEDTSVILISHSAATIRDFCTQAIWLHAGTVVAAGPVEEVCARYDEYVLNPTA